MLPYLGSRGLVATLVVAAFAVIGAAYAATERDWAGLVALLVLAYLTVLGGVTWGATALSLRTSTEVSRRQRKIAMRQAAQMRAIQTKTHRTFARLARSTRVAADEQRGEHSVERRYAGVLDQPVSAPNSRLLSMLELLAKDATTRRADDAILRRAIDDLRELVEMQQAEIDSLQQMVRRDALPSPRSTA